MASKPRGNEVFMAERYKAHLEAEVARLRTALEHYGQHDEDCARWDSFGRPDIPTCDCGLAAALRAQEAER